MEHALSSPTPLHGYQTLPGTLSQNPLTSKLPRYGERKEESRFSPEAYTSYTTHVGLSFIQGEKHIVQGTPVSKMGPYALLSKAELMEVVA